jgi:hypothetical protein
MEYFLLIHSEVKPLISEVNMKICTKGIISIGLLNSPSSFLGTKSNTYFTQDLNYNWMAMCQLLSDLFLYQIFLYFSKFKRTE